MLKIMFCRNPSRFSVLRCLLLSVLLLNAGNHLTKNVANASSTEHITKESIVSDESAKNKIANDTVAIDKVAIEKPSSVVRKHGALLPAPTAVISIAGDSQVSISWQAVKGAKSYVIYWSNNKGVSKSNGEKAKIDSPAFVHRQLKNGTSYHYVVTAIDAKGESVESTEVTAIPQQPVPAAPFGVTAVQFDGKITIHWDPVHTATSYNLYWSSEKNVTRLAGNKIKDVTVPYTHINLNNGATYSYVVTAVNLGGESALSTETSSVPRVAVPAAPVNFAAAAGDGEVILTWNNVKGATSYNVYWSVKPGVTLKTGEKIENLSPASRLTELTNGTPVYYVVTALNAAGESAISNEISAVPQISVAAAPIKIRAIPEDGKVTIRWQAVDGAASYNLYWSNKQGVTAASGKIIRDINTTEYTQLKLDNGSQYFYALTAVNAGGESALSKEVAAAPQIAVPAVPTNIAVVPGNGEVNIDWQVVANATSYNVYWSSVSGVSKISGRKIENVKPKQSLSKLSNGTQYFYIVTAVNAGGESADSIEVSVTPQVPAPAVPIGVSATPANKKVSIAWEKVAGATSYNIYWSTQPGVIKETATLLRNEKINGVQSNLLNGTRYYYAVAAVNAGGESALSNEVTAVPQVSAPAAPVDISVTIGDKEVVLNWSNNVSSNAGAISYNIFWNQTGNVTPQNTPQNSMIENVSPPYTHTGLKNGQTYYYIVTAFNAGGETVSQNIKVVLLPDAPVFTSVAGGDEQVVLSWGNVEHAKSYSLYWDTVPNVNSSSNKLINVESPYAHNMLTNGLTYYYVITANNESGEAVSNETVVTLAPDAPAIPVLRGGFEQVELDVKETIGAVRYHLYWNTTGNVTNKDAKIENILVNYKHLKLNNGSTYYYKISAENTGGESDLSAETNITLAPDTPTIAETKVADNSITLNWKEMPGAVSYNVYWNVNGSVTKKDNKITNTDQLNVSAPFVLSGLTKGATYYYAVTALNKGGESKLSAEFKAILAPEVPKILSLKGSGNQVSVNWTAMHGATSYNIYWDNEPGVTLNSKKFENAYSAKIKGASPAFIHSQIPNGKKYHYRVTAVNAGGESAVSIEDAIVLPPDAPVITSSSSADEIVTLVWSPVEHADSYTIYWGTGKGISIENEKIINATSPYTFYELENRRPYYYVITANNTGGESLVSSEVSVTPHNKLLSGMLKDVKLQQCIDELAKSSNWTYADQIVGTVYCSSAGIKNLSGIEFLVNISKLSLKNNSISNLEPLSSLTRLTSLSLDSNNISDVQPLVPLTKLTTLHLHNNSISDVSALADMTALNYLSLYKNSVADINALAGLTQLTSLYLNSNKIRDVSPIEKLVNLKFLDLGRNNIGGQGVGRLDLLTSLVNADNIHLIRNKEISCKELTTLITTMGSPPVDTDGINSNFDVAIDGTNCTNP